MERAPAPLVIDAPPRGPLAGEVAQAGFLLARVLGLAVAFLLGRRGPIPVVSREEDDALLRASIERPPPGSPGIDAGLAVGAAVSGADRRADLHALREASRRAVAREGTAPGGLDRPRQRAGADDERTIRRSHRPTGRDRAEGTGRRLARPLAPGRVRSNHESAGSPGVSALGGPTPAEHATSFPAAATVAAPRRGVRRG